MRLFVVFTLVGGDEGNILGSRRHTEYLVAIDLSLHLRQVPKGAGDARRKVWNVAHFHQQLNKGWDNNVNMVWWWTLCQIFRHSLGPNDDINDDRTVGCVITVRDSLRYLMWGRVKV